jgi:hypothetical protein
MIDVDTLTLARVRSRRCRPSRWSTVLAHRALQPTVNAFITVTADGCAIPRGAPRPR